MTSWQPIETAPKDGTWVILRGGGTTYRWDGDGNPPMVVAQFTDYLNGQSGPDFERWQYAWYDGGYLGIYENPTEWAPLPT